ncbi:COMPASS (complex proteins associated with Set1p) component [Parahypoxylon ruwenzoriense]
MTDEIPQTPVPVPHVVGQPAPNQATEAATAAQAPSTDSVMSDSACGATAASAVPAPTTEQAPSPAPATNAPSPAAVPARTGTPTQRAAGTNGQDASSSRAASQLPDPAALTMPASAAPHGAPVRQYLNTKVTGPLLEGMKIVARDRPKDPLRVLGEYLIQRSKELETA